MFYRLIISFSGALALGLLSPACSSKSKTSDPSEPPPREVQTVLAEQIPMERTVSSVGSLLAYEEATLSLKVPGRLQSIEVDLGSIVKKGDVIAQVEPQEYEAKLRQSQAFLSQALARLGLGPDEDPRDFDPNQSSIVREATALLDEAKSNLDRLLALSQAGVASKAELESITASYEVALNRHRDALQEARNRFAQVEQRRAEVDMARQQLQETTLRAPFDGNVEDKLVSVGEYLMVGAPIARLVRADLLRLRLEVPEKDAFSIRLKQEVRLSVTSDPTRYQGTIARLSPTINPVNRMLILEADVPNPGALRPGQFVKADILVDPDESTLSVPEEALTSFAGVEKVVIIEEGKAKEVPIKSGRRKNGFIEILSGIKPGTRVILNPGNLRTGQAVFSSKT